MYASTSIYVVDSPQNKARTDINFHNRKFFTVDCKTFFQSRLSMHLETCRTIVWDSLVTHRLVITIVNFASQLLNSVFSFNLRSFFFGGGGGWGRDSNYSKTYFKQSWCPFLVKIKTCWNVVQFLNYKPFNFVSLTDTFTVSSSKLLKVWSTMQTWQTAFWIRKVTATFKEWSPACENLFWASHSLPKWQAVKLTFFVP